jgi:hypothetical protein
VPRAQIVVERVSSIAGFNAVFRVMLDEHQVAVIPPGQTRTVTTSSGDHELYIRIRRRKSSRTLRLQLKEGQEMHIRCGRPKTAFEGVLDLLRLRKPDWESIIPLEMSGDA